MESYVEAVVYGTKRLIFGEGYYCKVFQDGCKVGGALACCHYAFLGDQAYLISDFDKMAGEGCGQGDGFFEGFCDGGGGRVVWRGVVEQEV